MNKNTFISVALIVFGILFIHAFSQNPPLPAPASDNTWVGINTFNAATTNKGPVVVSNLTANGAVTFNGAVTNNGTAVMSNAVIGSVSIGTGTFVKASVGTLEIQVIGNFTNLTLQTDMNANGKLATNCVSATASDQWATLGQMLSTNGLYLPLAGGTLTGALNALAEISDTNAYSSVNVGTINAANHSPNQTRFGARAGAWATNAQYAVAIGQDALSGATNAGSTVAIGTSAGTDAIGGDASVFIGDASGSAATNAEASIFIGYTAGQKAQSANHSIFIGPWCGQLCDRAYSLGIETAINDATNVAATAATSMLIYGEFDNRKISLNATNGVRIAGTVDLSGKQITNAAPGTASDHLATVGQANAATNSIRLVWGGRAGYGSTDGAILRFTRRIEDGGQGNYYQWGTNAANGLTVTNLIAGLYSLGLCMDGGSAESVGVALSRNASGSDLTSTYGINETNRLAFSYIPAITGSINMPSCSAVIWLEVNDVVRPHAVGTGTDTRTQFIMQRISK